MTILSTLTSNPASTPGSRDDVSVGDLVSLSYTGGPVSTYTWSLEYVPVESDGTPSITTLSSTSLPTTAFTADISGAYLVKLITDIGLITEATETVRLRALAAPYDLRLSAAGEYFDISTPIPTDATPTGWADDVNRNFLLLSEGIGRVRSMGAVYVNPDGTADYTTIQAAINALSSGGRIYLANAAYAENLTISTGNVYEIIGDERDGAPILQASSGVVIAGTLRVESSSSLYLKNCLLSTSGITVLEDSKAILSNVLINGGAATDTISIDDNSDVYLFDSFVLGGTNSTVYLESAFDGTFAAIRTIASAISSFIISNTDTPYTSRIFIESCNLQSFSDLFTGYAQEISISSTFGQGDITLSSAVGSAVMGFYSQMSRIVGILTVIDADFASPPVVYAYSTIFNSIAGNPSLIQQPASSISQTENTGVLGTTVQSAITALSALSDSSGIAYTGTAIGTATTVEEALEELHYRDRQYVQTTDDTPTSLTINAGIFSDVYPVTPTLGDSTYLLTAVVKARSASEFALFKLSCMVYFSGGSLLIGAAGVQNDFTDNSPGWSATISVLGSDALVDIVGDAVDSVDWYLEAWVEA